jgi:uncharacterized protein (TIGR03435 family)
VLAKSLPRLKVASVDETPGQRVSRGQITATATAFSQLATLLAGLLNRQVIDKTGLTDRYDFTLTYAFDASKRGTIDPDVDPAAAPDTPSVFTALQEQLGLKLESARGPVLRRFAFASSLSTAALGTARNARTPASKRQR